MGGGTPPQGKCRPQPSIEKQMDGEGITHHSLPESFHCSEQIDDHMYRSNLANISEGLTNTESHNRRRGVPLNSGVRSKTTTGSFVYNRTCR